MEERSKLLAEAFNLIDRLSEEQLLEILKSFNGEKTNEEK